MKYIIAILISLLCVAGAFAQNNKTSKPAKKSSSSNGSKTSKKTTAKTSYSTLLKESKAELEANPKSVSALKKMMNAYQGLGQNGNFIKTFVRYLKAGGEASFGWTFKNANWAHGLKLHEDALYLSQMSSKLSPNTASVLNLLGVSYFYLKKYRLSAISLKAAVALSPKTAIYSANLARTYEYLEWYKAAKKYYELCLKYDPSFKRSVISLKRVNGILAQNNNN